MGQVPFFAYMMLLMSLFSQENSAVLLEEGKPSMQVVSHPTAAAHQDILCRTASAKQQGRSPGLPHRPTAKCPPKSFGLEK